MKLFEISEKYNELLERGWNSECLTDDGEIDTEKAKTMIDELQADLNEKVESIAMFVENLNADIKALKEKEDDFKTRRQAKEKKVEWLKAYLTQCLDGRKFETPNVAISFRNSTSVNILNADLIPADYKAEFITTKIDKTAIKNAIKQGADIQGVELVENQNIQIK